MKKSLIFVSLILTFVIILTTVGYTSPTWLYAPDGRTIKVHKNEVDAYLNVGWYQAPVVTVYAPDGRSLVIFEYELATWESVGWIDGRKTTTIYSLDGRKATIPAWQFQSYKNVGWYSEPVLTMYAPDGRTTIVGQSEINSYKSVGWLEPYEFFLNFNFSGLKSYYGNKIKFVYGYGGGYFFKNPDNSVHFGFPYSNFKQNVYEMENSPGIPSPQNPNASQCVTIFSGFETLFPLLLTKATNGIIPCHEIEKYFNTNIEYTYSVDLDKYVSNFTYYNKHTKKTYLLIYYGDTNNNLSLNNPYVEVYEK